MRKMIVVAMREYQAAVRTKAFVISLIALPIMMGGSIAVQVLMRDKVDTADKRVAVVDGTGRIFESIKAAADQRNAEEIFREEGDARVQVRPRFLFEPCERGELSAEALDLALSDRVRSGELFAFVVIDAGVLDAENPAGRIAYHSNSPAYDDIINWMRGPVLDRIRNVRLSAAGLDAAVVTKLMGGAEVQQLGLAERTATGEVRQAQRANQAAAMLIPFGMLMLMFMMIMIGASPLVQSVLEEKMNRVAEVLLGSVRPFDLMFGKLVGMVGVSLTMLTIYLFGIAFAIHRAGYGNLFPAHLVGWFVAYQVLAVLMFGSLFVAIGAAVSDLKEAQSVMTPVMLVVVAPMFVWLNVVKEPSAPLSVVLSLIPPATPMLMLVRQASSDAVPLWQQVLGISLVAATTLLCVFAAGRIFRVGILMHGKGAKIGEMLRWILRG